MKHSMSILIVLTMAIMAGCSIPLGNGLEVQIVADKQLEDPASYILNNLVNDIKAKHPDDVQNYIEYCDKILTEPDIKKVQTYINFGLDYIIDKNVDDPLAAIALKSMFDIKVDGSINFDEGSMRLALDLVRKLKAALEG